MKLIIFTLGGNKLTTGQIYPFHVYREQLATRLGVIFDEIVVTSPDDETGVFERDYSGYDAAFVQVRSLSKKRKAELLSHITIPIVLLDSGGNVTLSPKALVECDVYVNKQLYSDRDDYTRAMWDGRTLSDFMIRHYAEKTGRPEGFFSKKGSMSKKRDISAEDMAKLCVGWNTATLSHLQDRLSSFDTLPGDVDRDIDVNCRMGLTTEGAHNGSGWSSWYYFHRRECLDIMASFSDRYSILAEGYFHKTATTERFEEDGMVYSTVGCNGKVDIDTYWDELSRSKICLSPFGMAEICIRDFEAIISGALLIKPDMSHIETDPDLYVPDETYVSVRWDLRDLEQKISYYLDHPAERAAIAERALSAYRAYFEEERFVDCVSGILKRSGPS